MSREVKFRVWHENKITMFHKLKFFSCGITDDLAIGTYSAETNVDCKYLDIRGVIDEAIIMQYTGLLDKNGIEIYEGDIVKLKGRNCVVYWNDCGFALKREDDYHVWEWGGKLSGYCDGLWGGPPEVIGNIYENKDLLK